MIEIHTSTEALYQVSLYMNDYYLSKLKEDYGLVYSPKQQRIETELFKITKVQQFDLKF